MGAGISIRDADVTSRVVSANGAAILGTSIVFLGSKTLARMQGVIEVDALATVGMFGAMSASTLAARMAMLDDGDIGYEGYIGAPYPFMYIAALVTAIVLAKLSAAQQVATKVDNQRRRHGINGRPIAAQLRWSDRCYLGSG